MDHDTSREIGELREEILRRDEREGRMEDKINELEGELDRYRDLEERYTTLVASYESLKQELQTQKDYNVDTQKKLQQKCEQLESFKKLYQDEHDDLLKVKEKLDQYISRETNHEDLKRLENLLMEKFNRKLFTDDASLNAIKAAKENSLPRLKITIGLFLQFCPDSYRKGLLELYFALEDDPDSLMYAQSQAAEKLDQLKDNDERSDPKTPKRKAFLPSRVSTKLKDTIEINSGDDSDDSDVIEHSDRNSSDEVEDGYGEGTDNEQSDQEFQIKRNSKNKLQDDETDMFGDSEHQDPLSPSPVLKASRSRSNTSPTRTSKPSPSRSTYNSPVRVDSPGTSPLRSSTPPPPPREMTPPPREKTPPPPTPYPKNKKRKTKKDRDSSKQLSSNFENPEDSPEIITNKSILNMAGGGRAHLLDQKMIAEQQKAKLSKASDQEPVNSELDTSATLDSFGLPTSHADYSNIEKCLNDYHCTIYEVATDYLLMLPMNEDVLEDEGEHTILNAVKQMQALYGDKRICLKRFGGIFITQHKYGWGMFRRGKFPLTCRLCNNKRYPETHPRGSMRVANCNSEKCQFVPKSKIDNYDGEYVCSSHLASSIFFHNFIERDEMQQAMCKIYRDNPQNYHEDWQKYFDYKFPLEETDDEAALDQEEDK